MKETQWMTNITIKEYFPKLKKIPYNEYNCIIIYNKEKQIIPLKNIDSISSQFSLNPIKKDLTYTITLINIENQMIIGESKLIIASLRLKQLKGINKIKYEQQIKIELNKKMKENLFGPGIKIGNIYLKFFIEISVFVNPNTNIFLYKIESKKNNNFNTTGNNFYDYNLSNLSLSSFLTNLSTLKENKKQNEKKIKKTPSSNIIKYQDNDNQSKQNNKEEHPRKVKLFSPNKIISLKKYKSKWHINKEYLKSNYIKKINIERQNKNLSTSIKQKKATKCNNKLRKAFSNENIMNYKLNIRVNTEISQNNASNSKISFRKNKEEKKVKTERSKQKYISKFKKIIKIKNKNNIDTNKEKKEINKPDIKTNIVLKNNVLDFMSLFNDIISKNKEIKNKINFLNSTKYLLIKEKIASNHKIKNILQNKFEEDNIKNFIHVNINKQSNNILLNKMTKIKSSELNIFKIIFNKKIINKENNKDPKLIIKEKLKQQKQIQILLKLIRNLIKIYGNLSHLYENDNSKQILIKSLFLRYNIKEKEWNGKDDLFDIYEKMIEENLKIKYHNKYHKEKEEFKTIKEEDEEEMNTIE